MTELTDLEICRKIAEIEGVDYFESDGIISSQNEIGQCREYNPLTDDALCFQLMVKHRIDVNHAMFTDDTLHRYQAVNTITGKGFGFSKNLNKAICLAIIEAHNE